MGSAAAGKYAKSFRIGFKAGFEYRVNFILSIASAIAPIVIQTALWRVLYGGDPSASWFGFTFRQMMAYTFIAQLVNRLVRTGFEYEMNADIKSGSLDRFLVKPIGYFGFRLFSFLGDKAIQSAVMGVLLAGAVAVMVFAFSFAMTPVAVALFIVAMVVAFALNFLLFWCIGLLGFWLTEIGFLFEAARIVIIAASGGILPLAVFGETGERILSWMPFRYTIQFPTELLTGRIAPGEALAPFAIAIMWIIALAALGQLAWARGVRRFAAVGS